jgi:hypothetical protein
MTKGSTWMSPDGSTFYDLTLATTTTIASVTDPRPHALLHVGQRLDGSNERAHVAWARAKSKTRAAMSRVPFKAAYGCRGI